MTSETRPQDIVIRETGLGVQLEPAAGSLATSGTGSEPALQRMRGEDHIKVDVKDRVSTFYSVTEAEIDVYAQFGWLASIFLALFGTASGFSLGCVTALVQSSIPAAVHSTLVWLAAIMGVVSVVFLAIAIALVILQQKNKKAWTLVK